MDKNVKKYANKTKTDLRRTDRAVTDPEWIKHFLERGAFGVLATTYQDQPFAIPVNYLYVEADHALYFHGAHVGRTRANLALNPQVCFNVSEMGAMYPGEQISEFGVEYQSVIVFGTAIKLTDQDKIVSVLLGLMQKYFPDHLPGEDYQLPRPEELKRTAVYQISIEEWTAKQLKKSTD